MNFKEAMNLVVLDDQVVTRKGRQHTHNYGDLSKPWSEWIRIRMQDDELDTEALIYIEENNFDDTTNLWTREWREDVLTKADVLADDWEIAKEE